MIDFLTLKKNLKKDFSQFKKIKIALLGDTSTNFINQALKGYGYEVQKDFEIYEADYNQVERQIFDPTSELYKFAPEFVIIYNSSAKLQKQFYTLSAAEKKNFADKTIENIQDLYNNLTSKLKCKLIFFNYREINDNIFGNYASKVEISYPYQLRKINFELMNLSQRSKNLFILDLLGLQSHVGNKGLFDAISYVNADIVFHIDFLPVVVKNITDIILAINGTIKKCLILDLDNTLWGGIIGDDGIENIQIGNFKIGKAFTDFQLWIKQLKERGIILAVCSKNEEQIAREPFENHPDMVLSINDFAIFVANWNSKVDNIKYIQEVLNIGFDSMVFFDDSPFERNVIRQHLPEVTVPELPKDPALYLSYLQTLNLFETASFAEEDEIRTKQYQEETKRAIELKSFTSEEDFLKKLGMGTNMRPFEKFDYPRIAQLTQRSNQFNLRTVRYTEEDIKQLAESPEYFTLAFNLSDKFGDYGLISVAILKKELNSLFIDTWIMSCRVLKRGMENLILNKIVSIANENDAEQIIGEYLPTQKNGIVKNLYNDLGFLEKDNKWILETKNYLPKKHFINFS
ncbi:MAG: hypothetical protein C0425_04610 [Chlorobiaceae bacterium]|nr:hypothetical protein [Chlorobiaceae bacterium]MBA4309598.1 hypothetical protein [Chlorobiaceae bacterium]